MNLDKLWSLVSEQTREYYADKKDKARRVGVWGSVRALGSQTEPAELGNPAEDFPSNGSKFDDKLNARARVFD